LIVTPGSSRGVSVMLGVPGSPGQYAPPVSYSCCNDPAVGVSIAIAAGDLNGDGLPDVVILNTGATPTNSGGSFNVFLSDPTHPGQLLPSTNHQISFSGVVCCGAIIAVADMNRDGIPDLVISTSPMYVDEPLSRTLLLTADPANPGNYKQSIVYSNYAPGNVTVADFNNDGMPDILLNNVILTGNTANADTFFAQPIALGLPLNQAILGTAVGDFNQDGLPDIAFSVSDNTIRVYLNDSQQPGTFIPSGSYPVSQNAYDFTSLVAGDFNAMAFSIWPE
jgi:hypothetical protein